MFTPKEINTDNEEPEIINDIDVSKKLESTKKILFQKSVVEVESSNMDLLYLVFGIQKACDEYGIDYEECLVLMYLKELGMFNLQLNVFSRRLNLGDYVLKGLIDEDYSHKSKKLYRLSKRGIKIVDSILKTISNKTKLIPQNRVVDLSLENKVSSVVSNYFK